MTLTLLFDSTIMLPGFLAFISDYVFSFILSKEEDFSRGTNILKKR